MFPMTKQRKHVTVSEAAERAGVTRQGIHDAIEAGKFPGAYQIGDAATAAYLIPLNELEAWMKTRKRRPKNGN